MLNNIGLHIRFFREKKFPGYGGQSLAAKSAKVSRAVWSRYESKERLASPTLKKIAKVLGVTVNELIAGPPAGEMRGTKSAPPVFASGGQEEVEREIVIRCLAIQELLARLCRYFAGDKSVTLDRGELMTYSGQIREFARILEDDETQEHRNHTA